MTSINSSSLILSLFNTNASGSSGVINTTLSTQAGSSGVQASALLTYNYYEKNGTKLKVASDKEPLAQKDIQYFKTKIAQIKSVDEIFSDQKLYKFVAASLGLNKTNDQFGIVKRALTGYAIDTATYQQLIKDGKFDNNGRPTSTEAKNELIAKGYLDPKNPTRVSVANQLTDTRYLQGALTLKLGSTGVDTIKKKETIDQLVSQYLTYKFEDKIAKESQPAENARYVKKAIGDITSVFGLLSDRTIRDVISTAYRIPKEIARQPVETQARVFNSKVDVAQLKDPKYVDLLIKKYLIASDQAQSQNSGSNSTALTLLQNR